MFADSAKVFIRSGKGGDGHVSFRRELYVAATAVRTAATAVKGGDVIFEVDDGLNTLTDFRARPQICGWRRRAGRKAPLSRSRRRGSDCQGSGRNGYQGF
ncbi:MAG: hypothetical protein ACLVAO_05345 [Clostridium fessum]